MDTIDNLQAVLEKNKVLPRGLKAVDQNNDMSYFLPETLIVSSDFIDFFKNLHILVRFAKIGYIFYRKMLFPEFLAGDDLLFLRECLLQVDLPTVRVLAGAPVMILNPVAEHIAFEPLLAQGLVLLLIESGDPLRIVGDKLG